MPNQRQRQRRSERDTVWTEDDTWGRVFADVVAHFDQSVTGHPDNERQIATEITDVVHEKVTTGLTDSQRRDAIGRAVAEYFS